MQFFEFIFLARKWVLDKLRIRNLLQRLRINGSPYWLLIFPEGTVVCEETAGFMKKHAESKGLVPSLNGTGSEAITTGGGNGRGEAASPVPSEISFVTNDDVKTDGAILEKLPDHTLLPKSKGLLTCCHLLVNDTQYPASFPSASTSTSPPTTSISSRSITAASPFQSAKKIVDLTIGFQGCSKTVYAYDKYLPAAIFFKGQGPEKVHIHIRAFDTKDVPLFAGSHNNITETLITQKTVDTGLGIVDGSEDPLKEGEGLRQRNVTNSTTTTTSISSSVNPPPPPPPQDQDLDTLLHTNEKIFNTWLLQLFKEKDEILRIYYRDGDMSQVALMDPAVPTVYRDQKETIRVVPTLWDAVSLLMTCWISWKVWGALSGLVWYGMFGSVSH
jgi:1-acyl-sn-glycerol-3-phosphate acyltransferase